MPNGHYLKQEDNCPMLSSDHNQQEGKTTHTYRTVEFRCIILYTNEKSTTNYMVEMIIKPKYLLINGLTKEKPSQVLEINNEPTLVWNKLKIHTITALRYIDNWQRERQQEN